MNKQQEKLYKRAPLAFVGFFLCMAAILTFLNNPFAEDASLPLTYWALLAFIASFFATFGTVGLIKIMLPVSTKNYVDECLKEYKKEQVSLKVIVFTTTIITLFFLTLWFTSPVSLSIFAQWIPLWTALAGGLLIGFLASLLLIVLLKFYIKNNKKYEDGRDNRISFRDA